MRLQTKTVNSATASQVVSARASKESYIFLPCSSMQYTVEAAEKAGNNLDENLKVVQNEIYYSQIWVLLGTYWECLHT